MRWTHLTIPVTDMEGSIRFFTETCGLSVVRDRRQEGRSTRTGAPVEGPTDAGGSVGYFAIVREPSGHLVEFTFGQPLRGLRAAEAA
jgi:catechol 2,3-dioxygenase-like lactoylglutathione lyase family enzyme